MYLCMGVQKLKLRCRVELCGENGGELIEYLYIQLSFDFFKKKYIFFLHFLLF
jgi:hypothetical protein